MRQGQCVPEAIRGKGNLSVSLVHCGLDDLPGFFILQVEVKVLLTYPSGFSVELILKVEKQ